MTKNPFPARLPMSRSLALDDFVVTLPRNMDRKVGAPAACDVRDCGRRAVASIMITDHVTSIEPRHFYACLTHARDLVSSLDYAGLSLTKIGEPEGLDAMAAALTGAGDD